PAQAAADGRLRRGARLPLAGAAGLLRQRGVGRRALRPLRPLRAGEVRLRRGPGGVPAFSLPRVGGGPGGGWGPPNPPPPPPPPSPGAGEGVGDFLPRSAVISAP